MRMRCEHFEIDSVFHFRMKRLLRRPSTIPGDDSPEIRYLHQRRRALGGYIPRRQDSAPPHNAPDLSIFKSQLEGTGERKISTTMAFVRLLTSLVRNSELSQFIVPIVPDESRTFGMEGMFRQIGIYSPKGQLYGP